MKKKISVLIITMLLCISALLVVNNEIEAAVGEDDGKTHVKGAKKTKNGEVLELEKLDCHQKAAEACPYNAIHIINLENKEKIL